MYLNIVFKTAFYFVSTTLPTTKTTKSICNNRVSKGIMFPRSWGILCSYTAANRDCFLCSLTSKTHHKHPCYHHLYTSCISELTPSSLHLRSHVLQNIWEHCCDVADYKAEYDLKQYCSLLGIQNWDSVKHANGLTISQGNVCPLHHYLVIICLNFSGPPALLLCSSRQHQYANLILYSQQVASLARE